MEALKKCLNPKVLLGLGIVAVGILVFAPKLFATALPLLILAACPVSMVLMMVMMGGNGKKSEESLSERYARGEIDKKEFEQIRKDING